jgi:ATP-dependent Lon protease
MQMAGATLFCLFYGWKGHFQPMPSTKESKRKKPKVVQEPSLYEDEFESETELAESAPAENATWMDNIPNPLPILPLRGLVVFPYTAIPLTVGQPRSLRLIEAVTAKDGLVGLFTSKDAEQLAPKPGEIYRVGTLAQIHRLFRAPDGTVRLLVQGLGRIRIKRYLKPYEPYLMAEVVPSPEKVETSVEVEALMRRVVDQFTQIAELAPYIPSELVNSTINLDEPLQTVYTIASYARLGESEQIDILEANSLKRKLEYVMGFLAHELNLLELGRKIQNAAQGEMEKVQREYFLREQLKAIQRELGEYDDQSREIEEFHQKIAASGMSDEARKEAERELDRLAHLQSASAEYGVIRTYLDWLVELPWAKSTQDNLDLPHARKVLNEDHYGLDDVKERILEFLAVRKLNSERQERLAELEDGQLRRLREGAILCFIGPPGVGKTSLGASIARALGRKFIRMSLGGVRDEAEMRGFRRTYVGAMPGRLIQALRRAGTNNPVVMLDEVDKLGRDFRGDPTAALLEVLDPEQNREFRDHYVDVAFDLSNIMFITTANELDPIPAPLRDRMEIIHLSGYTEREKVKIAENYLVARQILACGLNEEELSFKTEALIRLIREYTREAGVRNLEREIGKVVRKVAKQLVEGGHSPRLIDEAEVRRLLGHPKIGYQPEIEERTARPGVATGLAWTPMGGDILFVEAAQMQGAKGFQYTGQLGEVMQESARAAFSYVRACHDQLGISSDYFEKHDIHLHVPAGAIPKDGPSAGITMTTALVSLMTGRSVRHNIAMTGEITLRGQVLPVGGIKDKVLAADRFNLDTVILPKRNAQDLDELPDEVRQKMTFILADSVDEVLQAALLP